MCGKRHQALRVCVCCTLRGSSRWWSEPQSASSNESFPARSMRPHTVNETCQSGREWLLRLLLRPFMFKWEHWSEFVSDCSKSLRCCTLGRTHARAHLADGLSPLSGEEGLSREAHWEEQRKPWKGFKKAIDLPGTAKPSLSVHVMGREKVRRAEEEEEDRLTERDTARRRKEAGGQSEAGWDKWTE